MTMSSDMWDDRYAASDLVWSAEPNIWVEQLTADLPVGRLLDLAAGEGRNALWLAERGWDATAVDFSQVALDRAQQLAVQRLGDDASRFHTEQADVMVYSPHPQQFDLVLVVYLQIPAEQRWMAMRTAAAALAPGGRLMVIAHDSANLTGGVGGPQDPALLYTPENVISDLEGTDLVVEFAQTSERQVRNDGGSRTALDAVVVAVRPT
jgi:SAM-dependent methyltransferase